MRVVAGIVFIVIAALPYAFMLVPCDAPPGLPGKTNGRDIQGRMRAGGVWCQVEDGS